MLSLSSIACKNNSTNNDSPPPADTFTASEDTANVKTLIVKQASEGFSGETLKISFTSDKGFTTALTSAKTNNADIVFEDGVTLSSLYDSSTGALTITNKDLTNTTTTLKDADITISLVFTLTANDSGLQNATQTKNVDITIKKTTLISADANNGNADTIMKEAMKNVTSTFTIDNDNSLQFTFSDTADNKKAAYSKGYVLIENSTTSQSKGLKDKGADIITQIQNDLNSDSAFKTYFKSVALTPPDTYSGQIEITTKFETQDAYELAKDFNTKYKIKLGIGSASWD